MVTVIFLVALFAGNVFGLHPVVFGQFPVLLVMACGILDAAYHRDSVWRAADQNKLVWVIVQFLPVLGTMGYYVLVHRTLLEAEDRVPRE
jgi:hypothetical protein